MQGLQKQCKTLHNTFFHYFFSSLSPALEFERYDATRRLRLVLSELLAIMGHLQKGKERIG